MAQYCTACGKVNNEKSELCAGCGGPLENAGITHLPGSVMLDSRYEIIATVKAGTMGCIYKAKDTRLDMLVAVKEMASSFTSPEDMKRAEERFREEAGFLFKLHHPGLPRVSDYFFERDPKTGEPFFYLVMTFIDGKDLESLISGSMLPLPVDEVIDYSLQILEVLRYLHDQSPPVIYRNLNPRHVMIREGKVSLVDFGIDRIFSLPREGTAIGTPGYAAPEQHGDFADPRSDLYSLGALMHYLLTGINPGDLSRLLYSFVPVKEVNAAVPAALDSLIMALLDNLNEKRPESAEKVAGSLSSLSKESIAEPAVKSVPVTEPATQKVSPPSPPASSQASTPVAKTSPPRYDRTVVLIALVLIGLLLVSAMWKYLASRPSETPSPSATQAAVPAPAVTASKAPAPQALPPQKKNPKDGAAMILIPTGDFMMGSPEHKGDISEKPLHRVYLDAYYIYKYEVTNGQFRRFVHESRYEAEGSWKDYAIAGRDNHPVVCVTWNDAKAYCEWAGGFLPTEAQWEKAARGVDGRVWPWGNKWDGTECNWGKGPKVAGNADIWRGRGTAPVGSFPHGVSPYGVHDMAGNVAEWCGDWFGERYYMESPSKNPGGPGLGQTRALRFGNWFTSSPEINRCAFRDGDLPDRWLNFLGFRVCLAATIP